MKLIQGKAIAAKYHEAIKKKISELSHRRKPHLAVCLIGDFLPSHTYVKMKNQACQEIGMLSTVLAFPATLDQASFLQEIEKLNKDPHIDGILIQLPLPSHMDTNLILEAVDPSKDVDGLHPMNVGKMLLGRRDGFFPCTPKGVTVLLQEYEIDPAGKHVVILGRSNLVGKPLAAMLMQKGKGGNATVTLAHSHSQNLPALCQQADILVAAIGHSQWVTASMVKPGAVVIDVGINVIKEESHPKGYKIVGDVDFETVAPKCSAITPVPGGVGPMTIAMLLSNTWDSFVKRTGKS